MSNSRATPSWHTSTGWLLRLGFALLVGLAGTLPAAKAHAHQPFFEETDTTPATPMTVANPTISTALYATLDRADDVDYFSFDGVAGTGVQIGLTIPQIEGQDEFAPVIALIGPGLPSQSSTALPDSQSQALLTDTLGLALFQPASATTFYEPFSRTSYWRRQQDKITLPADGRYTLVVWSADAQIGRYTLVVGDREVLGGDPLFALKLSSYWTPVDGDASSPANKPTTSAPKHCGWFARIVARLTGQAPGC